jgi:hypothetical protein
MGLHTSRHTRKNSSFSTQDEPLVLLGLEALTAAPNLRYATRSIYRLPKVTRISLQTFNNIRQLRRPKQRSCLALPLPEQ